MTDTNKAKRASIANKIKALMAMSTANGCTEAEALTAAAKAAELMAEYDVSYTDVEGEVAAEVFGVRKREFFKQNGRKVTGHPVQYTFMQVGAFWDCRVWQSGAKLCFFGEQSDTENAHGMADMLRLAMDAEWHRYLNGPDRPEAIHGRTIRASFMIGMSRRLNERLKEMKAARSAADASARPSPSVGSTGTALVVTVKTRVVAQKFATYSRDAGLNIRSRSSASSVRSGAAFAAGQRAGGRVDIGGGKLAGASRQIGRG